MRSISLETEVSASGSCDYPPPVCDPGSGHIGQGRIFLRTHRVRDASFKGRMMPEKRGRIVMASFFLVFSRFSLYCMYCVEGLYCKRPIQCLASSEILTPPPPHALTARRGCTPLPLVRGEETLAGWRGGWGVNSSEDARHCSVLYICQYFVMYCLLADRPFTAIIIAM
jgi:hypothetical protein